MCEWLSKAEWCDVQLLCKGRVFSAHRAVLASVSPFMRRILLSCPEENSPTLIFLPDFDLNTMFSVLYYIYNGEVAVPKSSLETFLDIVITLQIYLDKHFLDIIKAKIHGLDEKFEKINAYSKDALIDLNSPKSVFKLDHYYLYDNKKYITIRKGHLDIKQGSLGCVDLGDTTFYCNQMHQQRPYLENKHSQHGDRQKKSFLRDSFIETYPRNGNVNGPEAGVPAISNELYLGTTSALLTNANGKDPRLNAASTENEPTSMSNIHASKKIVEDMGINQFNNVNNMLLKNDFFVKGSVFSSVGSKAEKMFDVAERKMSTFLDLTKGQSLKATAVPYQNQGLSCYNIETHSQVSKSHLERKCFTSNLTKKTISNEVMQNPWCPRLPISYRPSRRKSQTKEHVATTDKSVAAEMVNDKNNNIETLINPTDKNEIINISLQSNEFSFNQVEKESKDFTCNICNQVLPNHDSLTTHSKSHKSSARFTCLECGKTFSQLRNYKYHMSVHRGTKEFAASCTVCGKYFNDRGYLSSHMKIHRNRKEYKCQLCPKSFNQRVAYNMHVRIHTGLKPHVCNECGKAFSRKMLLKQHQRTHSGERPYACPHCDKRFADRSNMTLHLRLHTGVKPFSCSLCPKSFTKKHHLKSHLNYHTGAKPYSCPRCHLAFTQSSNMRTHLKKCNAKSSLDNARY